MLWQDCGSKFTSVEVRCGRQVSNTSVAKREAEKWPFGPSGVKTPEGNADFMSCLKARPTKRETFSATCKAATHKTLLSTKPCLTQKSYLCSVHARLKAGATGALAPRPPIF